MDNSNAMNNYIYCVREQASENNKAVFFRIVNADDLDLPRNSVNCARALQTVFVLGPFMDKDEAKDVESQAHSLLAKYRVWGDWLSINPLETAEFRAWLDAQILPIRVHEKRIRSKQSHLKMRLIRRPKVSVEQRAAVEQGTAKSPRTQS